jgi:hypothetical protein
MTVPRPVRRRPRRGAGLARWLVRVVVVVVVFGVGVAVGQALEDRPEAGEPVTTFGTIQPWTQTGPATATRTVTVTTP